MDQIGFDCVELSLLDVIMDEGNTQIIAITIVVGAVDFNVLVVLLQLLLVLLLVLLQLLLVLLPLWRRCCWSSCSCC